MAYSLTRWVALTRFLDDGRICMSNNAAERAVRPIAIGRKNWTFAGSDEGGHRAAAIYTLIQTARLSDVDPQLGSGIQYLPHRHYGSRSEVPRICSAIRSDCCS